MVNRTRIEGGDYSKHYVITVHSYYITRIEGGGYIINRHDIIILLWYGLGRPVITSEIGHWSVFVLSGWRFVFGIIMKRDGREPTSQMPSRLWE